MAIRYCLAFCLAFLCWVGVTSPAIAQTERPSAEAIRLTDEQIEALNDVNRQAFESANRGDFAQAEAYLTQLLEWVPNSAVFWSNRGNVRVSQYKLEAAIADFNQAIELAPDASDPYLNRGTAYEAKGDWDAAIASYNQAIELSPNDPAGYNNRGNAEAGLGQWDAAIADYEYAADIDRNFALARVNAALAKFQVDQVAAATKDLRNLVRKYPNFVDARAALTAVLWSQGKAGEAESNWVAVINVNSNYKDIDWVANIRRWPPKMVAALNSFLQL